jgi:Autotransporter beta-domain
MSANTFANNSSITQTNSGTVGGMSAITAGASTITQTNSGADPGGMVAVAERVGSPGPIIQTNSGSTKGMVAVADGANSPITQTNSGSNASGIVAVAEGANSPITQTNSGSTAGISATTNGANSNIVVTNSGVTSGGINLAAVASNVTLTDSVGGLVIGPISIVGVSHAINFQGGNWLFTVTATGPTTVDTGGAPFVVSGPFAAGAQIAALDTTTFALADRSLMNFTGDIAEMLRGRFDGMAAGASGGGALGFAPSAPGIADSAQAAFSGIPSVAMSYASGDSRPITGKAAPAAAPIYDTTVWTSGFGGERHQSANGLVLPTDDWAYGAAMGVDRMFGGNLRLGAFVGAGGGCEAVELNVQTIDSTYVFGGGYGRFDWATQYLDFALYGGGIDNKSSRQVANNTVANGLEIATASYGGWFISPELTYGYGIPFNAVTVTPRLRLRYVGGDLDGYSETGLMQNLSVGGRRQALCHRRRHCRERQERQLRRHRRRGVLVLIDH